MRLGVYTSRATGTLRVVTKDKIGRITNWNLIGYREDRLTPHNPRQEDILATYHDFLGSLELLEWRK